MNSQLNILVHLARADGKIDPTEIDLLAEIGKINGLSEDEVKEALEHPVPIEGLSDLTPYQKFECVCHLVQLMKADHKIADPEVIFCRKMAMNLWYDPEVIRALFTRLDQNPELRTRPDSLFNMVNDYND